MSRRIRIGDIIEITTHKGAAYAQYTHRDTTWGSLLRVLSGFYAKRPRDLRTVVGEKERFVTFFPLQAAVSQGILEIVGNEEVPEWARPMPTFREAGFIDREGRVREWWIGDRKVARLSDDERKLPILEIINDTALIERVQAGWSPERDRSSQ